MCGAIPIPRRPTTSTRTRQHNHSKGVRVLLIVVRVIRSSLRLLSARLRANKRLRELPSPMHALRSCRKRQSWLTLYKAGWSHTPTSRRCRFTRILGDRWTILHV
jgi:hypothetical protein